MPRSIATLAVGSFLAVGLVGALGETVQAAKPRKTVRAKYQEGVPAPVPFSEGTIVDAGVPCCEHKCCKKRERSCRHDCTPLGPPTVEYKGCPAPCSIDKIVSVTYPKTCLTVEVVVQVPAEACEKVDRDRDGDLELDYGKYEVSLHWKDRGRRLVVDYDD